MNARRLCMHSVEGFLLLNISWNFPLPPRHHYHVHCWILIRKSSKWYCACSRVYSKSLCCILIFFHNDCHCYQEHHLLSHYIMVSFQSSSEFWMQKMSWRNENRFVWIRNGMAIKFRKENFNYFAIVSLISEEFSRKIKTWNPVSNKSYKNDQYYAAQFYVLSSHTLHEIVTWVHTRQ